jgi:hypothetical protein
MAQEINSFVLPCACTVRVRAPLYGLLAPAVCWINKPNFRRMGAWAKECHFAWSFVSLFIDDRHLFWLP